MLCNSSRVYKRQKITSSVRKRPDWPSDSRQAFSPARPGQSKTDLGFSSQALEKHAGFMGPGRAGRLSVYSLCQVIILLRGGSDARRYLFVIQA